MAPIKDPNPGNHFTSQDRETLIRNSINTQNVVETMKTFSDDLKTLSGIIDWRFANFDTRIREVEMKMQSFLLAKTIIYSMCGIILVTVIGAIIAWTIK